MKKFLLAAALLALLPTVAAAGTITIQSHSNISNVNGLPAFTIPVAINNLGKTVAPGAYTVQLDGTALTPDSFLAFCLDVFTDIEFGDYEVLLADLNDFPNSLGTDRRGEKIAYLYNAYYADVEESEVKQAGLQMAIWNVIYDTDTDLWDGNFKALFATEGSLEDSVITAGQLYLATLGTNEFEHGNWLRPYVTIDGQVSGKRYVQSLVGPPVPEPGSMLLLGSGLIGLAGAARRRFAKK